MGAHIRRIGIFGAALIFSARSNSGCALATSRYCQRLTLTRLADFVPSAATIKLDKAQGSKMPTMANITSARDSPAGRLTVRAANKSQELVLEQIDVPRLAVGTFHCPFAVQLYNPAALMAHGSPVLPRMS
jgi:hypothetical protein